MDSLTELGPWFQSPFEAVLSWVKALVIVDWSLGED